MDSNLSKIGTSAMHPIPTGMATVGKLIPPVKCLLCDIYGTLFISGSGDIGASRQQAVPHARLEALIARYGLEIGVDELLRSLHRTVEDHHRQLKADGVEHPEVRIDEIWAQVHKWESSDIARPFAMEFEMIMNPVWPMPGMAGLLKACRDSGIVLGIISNAQFFTLSLFDRFMGADAPSLGFHPDLLFLSYRHGLAKPSAGLFQLAMSRLRQMGLSPKDTAFIGNDMRNDIMPARDMDFQTILFAGDARSLRIRSDDPHCAEVRPDLVASHLHQVIPFLKKS